MLKQKRLKSSNVIPLLLAALACCANPNTCQPVTITGPGASTPALIGVYANGGVSQGIKAPIWNSQYILMPTDAVVLDVQIPYPSTLQVTLTWPGPGRCGIPANAREQSVVLQNPPPPSDPVTINLMKQSPGLYTLQALNDVATNPFVVYRVTVYSMCAFNQGPVSGTAPTLEFSDIPLTNHSGASSAPPLYVSFNGPPMPAGEGSCTWTGTTWTCNGPPPATCAVPTLVGASAQRALTLLQQANLQPSIMGLGGPNADMVVTYQSPQAGATVSCGSFVTIYEAPGTPQTGCRGLQMWNCNQDGQALQLYLSMNGGPTVDQGSVAPQYQSGMTCGSNTSSPGKTLSFQTGNSYFVQITNPGLCPTGDPLNANCVEYTATYLGNSSGPMCAPVNVL